MFTVFVHALLNPREIGGGWSDFLLRPCSPVSRCMLSLPNMLVSPSPASLLLSLSCLYLASGHACRRAIVLRGLCDWGFG